MSATAPLPEPAVRRPRFPLPTALLVLAGLACPLLVWLAPGQVDRHWLPLALAALALGRAALTRERLWLVVGAATSLLAAASLWTPGWAPVKLYPALVNLVFLATFATSLRHGPPVVERLARLREAELPPAAIAYTRRVTQAWCAFFALNAGISAAMAVWADTAHWALWTGVLSYVAMGALMGGEWLVRRRVRARTESAAPGAIDG